MFKITFQDEKVSLVIIHDQNPFTFDQIDVRDLDAPFGYPITKFGADIKVK